MTTETTVSTVCCSSAVRGRSRLQKCTSLSPFCVPTTEQLSTCHSFVFVTAHNSGNPVQTWSTIRGGVNSAGAWISTSLLDVSLLVIIRQLLHAYRPRDSPDLAAQYHISAFLQETGNKLFLPYYFAYTIYSFHTQRWQLSLPLYFPCALHSSLHTYTGMYT